MGSAQEVPMRGITALIIGLALAACTQSHDKLWPGPEWKAEALPGEGPTAAAADEPDEATPGDATSTRVPRNRTRRSSSTSPDLLFDNQPRRPQVVQPSAPPPVRQVDQGNSVIAPGNPSRPYSADGYGYQRQGTTIQGPQGETYNRVGSSIISPSGRACTAVGNSIMC
jgi:hypothetical protein